MSSSNPSSSSESAAMGSGGAHAHLRFNGKAAQFGLWKMRAVAYMRAHKLYDVVEFPLAPTDKEVRKLLAMRPGDCLLSVSGAEEDDEQDDAAGADAAEESQGAGAADAKASSSSSSGGADGEDKKLGDGPWIKAKSASSKKQKKMTAKQLETIAKKEQKERMERVERSLRAYAFLLSCLLDAQSQLLTNVPSGDAHGAWKILLAQFERKSTASKHMLRTKLLTAKMEKGEKFDSFLSRIQELQLRLVQMDSSFSDDDMIHVLLEGLAPGYAVLVESLKMSTDLELEDVLERCRDYQERRTIQKQEAAHFARPEQNGGGQRQQGRGGGGQYAGRQQQQQRGGGGGGGGAQQQSAPSSQQPQQQPSRACHVCSKTTHLMFDCPSLPTTALKCTRCRRLGHLEKDCRSFVRPRRDEFVASAEHAPVQEEDPEEWSAFAVTSSLQPDQEEHNSPEPSHQALLAPHFPAASAWSNGPPKIRGLVMDTGATVHMSCEKAIMMNVRSIHPVTVRVANDQTIVLEQGGDVRLRGEGKATLLLKDVVHDSSLAANLISVSKLVDSAPDVEVIFTQSDARVTRGAGALKQTVAVIPRVGNLYVWPHEASCGTMRASLKNKV